MCGRTCLCLNKKNLQNACSYKPRGSTKFATPAWVDEHNGGREFVPSYNIAPSDITPVLVSTDKFRINNETDRIIKPMMWGIIPPWHKGDYRNHGLTTNNCRLENIKSSKLYGPALRDGGRCVIVVEGFYEWQTTNKSAKSKQPYYIYAPQDDLQVDKPQTWTNDFDEEHGWKGVKLLHLAGVYSIWQNADVIIYSYSVITMESNKTFDWLHHRIPAILDCQDQIDAWLDVSNVDPDMALCYLKPVNFLSWHPVSTAVNNARHKSSDCNQRIVLVKERANQKAITNWFGKSQKRKSEDGDSDAKKIKTDVN